ncbi:MAG: S8 family serine peptidase [Proteobacteria bacterium]|nr:S8 family serine peptidase [Pseudomonadota bacterium]
MTSLKHLRRPVAVAALTLALLPYVGGAWAKGGGAGKGGGSGTQVAGDVLVRLDRTTSLPPLLGKYPLTLAAQFGARPIYRLRVIGSANVDALVGQLALEPTVMNAEPNFVHESPEARKNVVWAIGTPEQYANQWFPAAMNLPAAQAKSTGKGIKVAVLDTGADLTHPALVGHLIPGYDFVDDDRDPSEVGSPSDAGYGHGTHVAGLIALTASDAQIMPLRVLDPSGQGNVWVLAQAMLYALDPDGNPATDDGVQVINESLGTLSRTRIIESIMKISACELPDPAAPGDNFSDPGYNGDRERCSRFRSAVVVAAAGNGASSSELQYPAAANEYGLLPITATTSGNKLATFSNYGSWVQVAAPGDKITSSIPGGGYGTWSGTSMASPLAAGTAALVMQLFPALTAKDVADRIENASTAMCNVNQRQIDALGSIKGTKAPSSGKCR